MIDSTPDYSSVGEKFGILCPLKRTNKYKHYIIQQSYLLPVHVNIFVGGLLFFKFSAQVKFNNGGLTFQVLLVVSTITIHPHPLILLHLCILLLITVQVLSLLTV